VLDCRSVFGLSSSRDDRLRAASTELFLPVFCRAFSTPAVGFLVDELGEAGFAAPGGRLSERVVDGGELMLGLRMTE
jgi:hypothetical protein